MEEESCINEYLRRNNEQLAREVAEMLKHPTSREQMIAQIRRLQNGSSRRRKDEARW